MAFIRRKTVNGKEYAQVVESYRVEGLGTPRQRVLLHLGDYTPAKALIYWPRFAGKQRELAAKDRAQAEKLSSDGYQKHRRQALTRSADAHDEDAERWESKVSVLRGLTEQGKLEVSEEDLRQVEEESAAALKRLEELTARIEGRL